MTMQLIDWQDEIVGRQNPQWESDLEDCKRYAEMLSEEYRKGKALKWEFDQYRNALGFVDNDEANYYGKTFLYIIKPSKEKVKMNVSTKSRTLHKLNVLINNGEGVVNCTFTDVLNWEAAERYVYFGRKSGNFMVKWENLVCFDMEEIIETP